jgi:hypothetical protein
MNDGLLKVSTGYKLVFWSLIVYIATFIIAVVAFVVLIMKVIQAVRAAGGGGGPPPAWFWDDFRTILYIALGLYAFGVLLTLLGRIMCLAVPQESGAAKPLITVSVVLEVIAVIASAVITADMGGNAIAQEVKQALAIVSAGATVVAIVLFLLFTKSCAEYVRRPDLARRATSVLWLAVLCAMCYGAVIGISAATDRAAGGGPQQDADPLTCAGACLALVFLVLFVVVVVLYAILLVSMSAATRKFATRSATEDDYGDFDDEDDDRDDDDDYDDGRGSRPWDRGGR